jgi:hypothetical protein
MAATEMTQFSEPPVPAAMVATAAVVLAQASARGAAMEEKAVSAAQHMQTKTKEVIVVGMAPSAVPLPRWVRSIFTMVRRLSPPRQILMEVVKALPLAMVVLEAVTLYTLIDNRIGLVLIRMAAAQAVPVAASAAQPATSVPVALAAEVAEAVPQVVFNTVNQ